MTEEAEASQKQAVRMISTINEQGVHIMSNVQNMATEPLMPPNHTFYIVVGLLVFVLIISILLFILFLKIDGKWCFSAAVTAAVGASNPLAAVGMELTKGVLSSVGDRVWQRLY